MKDYYKILDVPKEADAQQIKSAYRKLAHKWHPDKNPDKVEEAEERFKEISEAYSVLSDPGKKDNYDRTGNPEQTGPFGFKTTGDPFEMFRNFTRQRRPNRPQPMKGQSVQYILPLQLKDALFGSEANIDYSVASPCATCEGKGGSEFENCEPCRGTGFITQQQPGVVMQSSCKACGTSGKRISKACEDCKGQGIINQQKEISVQVPSGMRHGSTLRVNGAGGNGMNGGPPGDVLIRIDLQYPNISALNEDERSQLKQLLSQ